LNIPSSNSKLSGKLSFGNRDDDSDGDFNKSITSNDTNMFEPTQLRRTIEDLKAKAVAQTKI
jgi:hypothetical protein